MNKLLSNMLAGIGAVVVARTLADNFTIVRRNDEDEAVKALSEIKYDTISDARDILEKAKKTLIFLTSLTSLDTPSSLHTLTGVIAVGRISIVRSSTLLTTLVRRSTAFTSPSLSL